MFILRTVALMSVTLAVSLEQQGIEELVQDPEGAVALDSRVTTLRWGPSKKLTVPPLVSSSSSGKTRGGWSRNTTCVS